MPLSYSQIKTRILKPVMLTFCLTSNPLQLSDNEPQHLVIFRTIASLSY
jgi:hypothetical protein